jgi:hypothetical protein
MADRSVNCTFYVELDEERERERERERETVAETTINLSWELSY